MAELLDLLIVLIPIYVANASPVVLGGGAPLDLGGRMPDGRRILGHSKTVRGFVGGVLAGTVAGGLIALGYPLPFFAGQSTQFIAAFVLSFGTLSGDAIGSFIKRRFGVASGRPFALDTIMFLAVALALAYPLARPELYAPVALVFFAGLTLIMHPLMNMVANKAGLKNVPW